MKILIAIVAAQHRIEYADAQRATWIKDIPEGVDYKFFLGQAPQNPSTLRPDEEYLNAPDDYAGLSRKSRDIISYAYWRNYDYMLHVDDDTCVSVANFLASDFAQHDYTGGAAQYDLDNGILYHVVGHKFIATGAGIVLSSNAMNILLKDHEPMPPENDVWIYHTLAKHGIHPNDDARYVNLPTKKISLHGAYRFGPNVGFPSNAQIITSCEHPLQEMYLEYARRKTNTPLLYERKLDTNDIRIGTIRFSNPG